ncbi:MAG: hypothetical protein I8H93_10700 [Pseudomonadales bacterium]|nr:hypothetical protein [Pseudomonadales bacterium]
MKIQTIAQAKANARAAHDRHCDLLRMQEKLKVEIPQAYAEWQAANAITLRLMAQRGGADSRAAELSVLQGRIKAAKAGLPAEVFSEPANDKAASFDELVNQIAGA